MPSNPLSSLAGQNPPQDPPSIAAHSREAGSTSGTVDWDPVAAPPNAPGDPQSDRTTVRRFVYALIIAIAAASGLAAILNATILYEPDHWPEQRPPHSPMFSANDRSRWCTVWSLAERGTYQIDEIIQIPGWDSIDKVRHDGHFYSSKPALLPTLVAGLYWTLKQVSGLDMLRWTHVTVHVLLIAINLIPWLIALVLLAVIGERYARTDISRLFLVVTAAVGTFLTTFLTTFNNHNVAAVCAIFAIYPTLRILLDGRRDAWLFAHAGFWAMFAVTNELPAAPFGLALFIGLFRASPARSLKFFAPAALVPFIAFLTTTYISTGSWLPFYTKYGTEAYRYVHEGVPSYWMTPAGIDAGIDSPAVYLWHCLFGHHGIFSLSPVFLLTLATWCGLRKWRDVPLRNFCWLSLGLTVFVLVFYLTRTDNYNYGGNTAGLRWAFWLIPFWLISMIPALDTWGHRKSIRLLTALLLGISVFSVTYPRNNPWKSPWLQSIMDRLGWVNYRTPLNPLTRRHFSWLADWPTAPEFGPQPWIELLSSGRPLRMRLEALPTNAGADANDGANGVAPAAEAEESLHILRVRERDGTPGLNTPGAFTIAITDRGFTSERKPADILRTVPDHAAAAAQAPPLPTATARRFLQGLPHAAEYRLHSERYIKTPLRPDAFRCLLLVAHARYRPDPDGPVLLYRRMVWLCDEVPFGVLQFEDTVTDPADNAIVFRQLLTASAASGLKPPATPATPPTP